MVVHPFLGFYLCNGKYLLDIEVLVARSLPRLIENPSIVQPPQVSYERLFIIREQENACGIRRLTSFVFEEILHEHWLNEIDVNPTTQLLGV